MDDGIPICWWKGEAEDYLNPEANFVWNSFTPDKAIKAGRKVKSHMSGLFQMKCYFHSDYNDGVEGQRKFNPKKYLAWKNKPPRRLEVFNIRVYIYQAESLPPCDASGASDPYIEVWQPFPKKSKTITCEQTNNPLYYQAIDIRYEFFSLIDAPPIILFLYDTDEGFFESDDYMGKSVIYLKDLGIENLPSDDRIVKPCWYPVKSHIDDPFDPEGPRVLCSFAFKDIHDLKTWNSNPEDITLTK